MGLLAENALRGGRPGKRKEWKTLVFKCVSCGKDIEVLNHPSHLKRATGKCRRCASLEAATPQRKRPFENLYNSFRRAAAYEHKSVEFSFEDFLAFTIQATCHYCGKEISWRPYGGGPYNLDRKDNSLGYSRENCVVCCGDCNKLKGNRFSYEEMLELVPALHSIQEKRNRIAVSTC